LPLSTGTNPAGETYYKAEYDIVLSFGLTELKAQVAWRDENGTEQRSAAKIIYDSDLDID